MKTVLITGGTGNLGKIVLKKFQKEGYHIVAIVSPGKSKALEQPDSVSVYEADLTNEAATYSAIEKIIADHKSIDAALLLAGGFAAGGIDTTDIAALDKMMATNFNTAYFVARPVFAQMKKQSNGGRIIFVGSNPALLPSVGKDYLAYSLSKSMLFKLAEFLNADNSGSKVVASVIVPGTIDTPANREAMPSADFKKWVSPEDIADAMIYLSSERGSSLRDPILKMLGN